jgi:hypothetical protein
MNEQENRQKQEELVRELVRIMGRTPKTPHEAERRVENCKGLQNEIDEIRHAGEK